MTGGDGREEVMRMFLDSPSEKLQGNLFPCRNQVSSVRARCA